MCPTTVAPINVPTSKAGNILAVSYNINRIKIDNTSWKPRSFK